jgi:nitrite reductase (NADH) large subunit
MSVSVKHNSFQAELQKTTTPLIATDEDAIVIVGSGPVGVHFYAELVRRNIRHPVIIYGAEPWQPYDRVKLSSYLAGDVRRENLPLDVDFDGNVKTETRFNCPVLSINRNDKTIIDVEGRKQKYSHLVLAVGSSPYIPLIHNSHLSGVYTFRSLSEADRLYARIAHTRQTVVLGGGLLGLETARAMQRYNTQITVVEHNHWLMMQQLDEDGGNELKGHIENMGMEVVLGDSVVAVIGEHRVTGVKLRSGKKIDCDTFIIATGIRANLELAKEAGISFGKGIRVDESLQTSDPDIFAIGECAEYQGVVQGLVKPGFDMAAVLADRLTGGKSKYRNSIAATHLKVMQQKVFSTGSTGNYVEASASVREYVYRSKTKGLYRKIRVSRDRLIGAISIGDWHESALLQDAIRQERRVWLWHIARFKTQGNIWSEDGELDVADWPASAVVCNCADVTRGRLSQVLASGCTSINCLAEQTRAGTICGSCKPLLAELTGDSTERQPASGWRSLLLISLLSFVLVVLFVFVWRMPYADSVQVSVRWDELWRNSLFKQITGFSMLALIVAGMLMSLRKRSVLMKWGDYSLWRLSHAVLGTLALLVLVAHTGLRLGSEMNLVLMICFMLLAVVGANAGRVIANEHNMAVGFAKKQRTKWTGLHLLLAWPLPVLLGFHVIKTYYF